MDRGWLHLVTSRRFDASTISHQILPEIVIKVQNTERCLFKPLSYSSQLGLSKSIEACIHISGFLPKNPRSSMYHWLCRNLQKWWEGPIIVHISNCKLPAQFSMAILGVTKTHQALGTLTA